MKAPDIQYECPRTLAQALASMASGEHEFAPLAGGQSLMPMMHLRLARPDALLDLNRVSELSFIDVVDGYVVIGAMVRYSELLASETIQQHVPLFHYALPYIAHEAIRNRGTIGGSTALADPAAEMPALLKALDATIVVISADGTREIPADDFFLGMYETALNENELVHSIRIPVASARQQFGFYELARRHGDYAMTGVAISASSVEPYSQLRIVFFSVSDAAVRATEAEAALNGCTSADTDALRAAQEALSFIDFYEDLNATSATKLHLSKVVLQRALQSMRGEKS